MIPAIFLWRASRGTKVKQQRDPADDGQGDQAEERAVGAEEDRDGHDREELPDRPGSHDERTETPLQHPVVPQDGQQGAQRGRGQADGDRHERMHEAGRRQGAGHADRDQHCHQPGCECEPSGPLAEQPKLKFVARQQEKEPQAHVGYQLDAVRVGPAQHLRPDQDPAHNEDHHLRHPEPGEQARHDRGQRGDQADDGEVDQALLKSHRDNLPAPRQDRAGRHPARLRTSMMMPTANSTTSTHSAELKSWTVVSMKNDWTTVFQLSSPSHWLLVGGRCSSLNMARISPCVAASSSSRFRNRACVSAVAAGGSTFADAMSVGSLRRLSGWIAPPARG